MVLDCVAFVPGTVALLRKLERSAVYLAVPVLLDSKQGRAGRLVQAAAIRNDTIRCVTGSDNFIFFGSLARRKV